MNVFTRHRTGASDSSTTTRRPSGRSSVASRMREQRETMPIIIAGTRLSV